MRQETQDKIKYLKSLLGNKNFEDIIETKINQILQEKEYKKKCTLLFHIYVILGFSNFDVRKYSIHFVKDIMDSFTLLEEEFMKISIKFSFSEFRNFIYKIINIRNMKYKQINSEFSEEDYMSVENKFRNEFYRLEYVYDTDLTSLDEKKDILSILQNTIDRNIETLIEKRKVIKDFIDFIMEHGTSLRNSIEDSTNFEKVMKTLKLFKNYFSNPSLNDLISHIENLSEEDFKNWTKNPHKSIYDLKDTFQVENKRDIINEAIDNIKRDLNYYQNNRLEHNRDFDLIRIQKNVDILKVNLIFRNGELKEILNKIDIEVKDIKSNIVSLGIRINYLSLFYNKNFDEILIMKRKYIGVEDKNIGVEGFHKKIENLGQEDINDNFRIIRKSLATFENDILICFRRFLIKPEGFEFTTYIGQIKNYLYGVNRKTIQGLNSFKKDREKNFKLFLVKYKNEVNLLKSFDRKNEYIKNKPSSPISPSNPPQDPSDPSNPPNPQPDSPSPQPNPPQDPSDPSNPPNPQPDSPSPQPNPPNPNLNSRRSSFKLNWPKKLFLAGFIGALSFLGGKNNEKISDTVSSYFSNPTPAVTQEATTLNSIPNIITNENNTTIIDQTLQNNMDDRVEENSSIILNYLDGNQTQVSTENIRNIDILDGNNSLIYSNHTSDLNLSEYNLSSSFNHIRSFEAHIGEENNSITINFDDNTSRDFNMEREIRRVDSNSSTNDYIFRINLNLGETNIPPTNIETSQRVQSFFSAMSGGTSNISNQNISLSIDVNGTPVIEQPISPNNNPSYISPNNGNSLNQNYNNLTFSFALLGINPENFCKKVGMTDQETMNLIISSVDKFKGNTWLRNYDTFSLSRMIVSIMAKETDIGTGSIFCTQRANNKDGPDGEVFIIQMKRQELERTEIEGRTVESIIQTVNRITGNNYKIEDIQDNFRLEIEFGTYYILEYFNRNTYMERYFKKNPSISLNEMLKIFFIDYNGGHFKGFKRYIEEGTMSKDVTNYVTKAFDKWNKIQIISSKPN